jgi:hypothetical protein
MKAGQDVSAINGADRQRIASIYKADRPAPIEPLHQSDFSLTQGAIAVEPDCHLFSHDDVSGSDECWNLVGHTVGQASFLNDVFIDITTPRCIQIRRVILDSAFLSVEPMFSQLY